MTDNADQKKPMRPIYVDSAGRDFLDSFLKEGDKPKEESPNEQSNETDVASLVAMSDKPKAKAMQESVIEMLQSIYDPEIPVNLYDLGLIYEINVDDDNNIAIAMTLTTPHCPVAESMPGEVQTQVMLVEGVGNVSVDLVWEPPWDMSRMSEEARLELGFI
jgi:FeS assembly SUF system protein